MENEKHEVRTPRTRSLGISLLVRFARSTCVHFLGMLHCEGDLIRVIRSGPVGI
uniref:Uncharacterized protein n=1 Tax=Arundo donax TaxID=35708 RepID=A0A0A9GZN1_ARUDO